jgi:hypothetical protein
MKIKMKPEVNKFASHRGRLTKKIGFGILKGIQVLQDFVGIRNNNDQLRQLV